MEKDVRDTHKDNTEIHDYIYTHGHIEKTWKNTVDGYLQVAETLMAIVIILKNKNIHLNT